MTVLVTGATGRLGRRLVEKLVGDRHQVRVLTRRPFLADRLFGSYADVHEWHPGVEPVPEVALAGIAAVAHLMGEAFEGPGTTARLQSIGVSRGVVTQRFVDALGTRRIRLVTVSCVVPQPAAGAAAELRDNQDVALPSNGLGAVIAANEAIALEARARGLSVAIARLGLLLEPGEIWTRAAALAARGVRLPFEGARIPVIHPDDASALVAGLLTRTDLEGIFYGVAPLPLEGRRVIEVLAPARRFPLRWPMLRRSIDRRLGPLAPVLQSRTHHVPQRLIEAGAIFTHPDPNPVAQQLLQGVVDQRRWFAARRAQRPRQIADATAEMAVGAPASVPAHKSD